MNLINLNVKKYIGFAIKSRQIVFGLNDTLAAKKVKLIVISSNLSENSIKKIDRYVLKCGAKFVIINSDDMASIFGEAVLVAGITNENLGAEIYALLSKKAKGGENFE